jgi:hypothetical protein
VSAEFTIAQGILVLTKQSISFFLLQKNSDLKCSLANKIGSQIFKATISGAEKRENTYNNTKNFAVEVIDQKHRSSNSNKSS